MFLDTLTRNSFVFLSFVILWRNRGNDRGGDAVLAAEVDGHHARGERDTEGSGVRRLGVVHAAPVPGLRVEADVLHGEIPRQDVLAPVAVERDHRLTVIRRYIRLVQQFIHQLVLVRRRLGQFLHQSTAWLNGLEFAT